MFKKISIISAILATSLVAGDYASVAELEQDLEAQGQNYNFDTIEGVDGNDYKEQYSTHGITEAPYVFLNIKNYDMDTDNAGSDNAIGYEIGFGADAIRENDLLLGARISIGFSSLDNYNLTDVTGEGKFGYHWHEKSNGYLIGGFKYTNVDPSGANGFAAYGFGLGAGVDYAINKNIGIALEYTTYFMDPDEDFDTIGLDNYDNHNITLQLKYTFAD